MPSINRSPVTIIELCDYDSFPPGGQLTFAKSLVSALDGNVFLVGFSTSPETPVGTWSRKKVAGYDVPFFAVGRYLPRARRPFVPRRLTGLAQLIRYRRAIMELAPKAVFIQSPEVLLAASRWPWDSICFRFPGSSNALSISRYPWAKPLASLLDSAVFTRLRGVDCVLATVDAEGIRDLVRRGRGSLAQQDIVPFPTRVDTTRFCPMPIVKARAAVDLPGQGPVFVASGRISRTKGWPLVLDGFLRFRQNHPGHLVFVGDGEDLNALLEAIHRSPNPLDVTVTGFQPPDAVAQYLNAANAVLVGSECEGWSNSMLEAVACGKPVVSTPVSGAAALIESGVNGYIVDDRSPSSFAYAMERVLELPDPAPRSLESAGRYALSGLRSDLASCWPAVSQTIAI